MSGKILSVFLLVIIIGAGVAAVADSGTIVSATNPTDGAAMVWVPAGDFLMGTNAEGLQQLGATNPSSWVSRTEGPQHPVYLEGYWMYTHPVTVAQFRTFCEATGRPFDWEGRQPFYGWSDNHPMTCVSYAEATAYATWAGVTIPTEAQWEKAARGVDGRIYPWGNTWDGEKCAWWGNEQVDGTWAGPHDVGQFPAGASPYGAQDMVSFLLQWTSDAWSYDYYATSPRENPTGPGSGMPPVMRGGLYAYAYGYTFPYNGPVGSRVTSRTFCSTGEQGAFVTFRCVSMTPGARTVKEGD
jgi:formylglycine-generating enzyme required for sulfatase activity